MARALHGYAVERCEGRLLGLSYKGEFSMGIYGAMTTAVAGLRAQSLALENISGNISNVQTPGFKRMETSFYELVPSATMADKGPSSVQASGRQTVNVSGSVSSSDIGTNMAITGDGFFNVRAKTGDDEGEPILSQQQLYTRRGDFEFDANGYLVNGAGYYLTGIELDKVSGAPIGGDSMPIKIERDFIAAKPTTEVALRANLPRVPATPSYDAATPGSDLIDIGGGGAPTTITQAQDAEFKSETIAGGSITVRTDNGEAMNLQLRWGKTGTDAWSLYYMSNSDGTTDPAWTKVGDYTFTGTGALNTTTTPATTNLSIDGTAINNVAFNHGTGGMTQYADASGLASTTELSQNGYAAGELVEAGISASGRVTASYSNGQTYELYDIPVSTFNAPNRLQGLDGGAYAETFESGAPVSGSAGSVKGGALEGSNTDIADEFTKLIVTQQAYSAGTRIVTTSDEMMQEALNMKR